MKSVLGRIGEGKGYCVLLTLLATWPQKQCIVDNYRVSIGYSFNSIFSLPVECTCFSAQAIAEIIQTTQSVFLAVPTRMHPFEDLAMTSLLTVVLNKQMAIIDLTSQVSSLIK